MNESEREREMHIQQENSSKLEAIYEEIKRGINLDEHLETLEITIKDVQSQIGLHEEVNDLDRLMTGYPLLNELLKMKIRVLEHKLNSPLTRIITPSILRKIRSLWQR